MKFTQKKINLSFQALEGLMKWGTHNKALVNKVTLIMLAQKPSEKLYLKKNLVNFKGKNHLKAFSLTAGLPSSADLILVR